MKLKSSKEAREYMLSKPNSNFVVFTHQNRRWPRMDYLIRRAVYYVPRYDAEFDQIPSHCGSVWVKDGELMYYHQTWPIFKKDRWGFRQYNVICEIACKRRVKYARAKCREMLKKKRGYGVGQLLSFLATIWFTWFSNPITAGKVCSEAVAVSYPKAVLSEGVNQNDVDPYYAMIRIKEKCFKSFIVDRR